ncbi:alkaline-phosphatase-like protein [Xylaria cf. heliscus]|nr:alkaline-phosphatase-like protein [Xylaria cf. heliscus]
MNYISREEGCHRTLSGILPTCFGLFGQRPNIVFIITDDQDLHLGSLDYQPVVRKLLAEKGTTFSQHYVTVAKCCPSRASLLRGQAGHNTNITEVSAPGGNYDKWLISGENDNYLPHWLVAAGYNADYIGKIMNGYNTANYAKYPGGWTHTQTAVDDYTYQYNNVVMSLNGQTPISYAGYHQSDVIRAMAYVEVSTIPAGQRQLIRIQVSTELRIWQLNANHFSLR